MSDQPTPSHDQNGVRMRLLEQFIFSYRPVLLTLLFVITIFFAFKASQLTIDTSFMKMIPAKHPYIQAMLSNMDELGYVGTVLQISVETTEGDIFTKEYLDTVKSISDEVFYLKGVNRTTLESIWTPNVRWTEVTEEGFEGGPLMPDPYNGSDEDLLEFHHNILRSARVGSLVADNFKSTMIQATLFDTDPVSGEFLDYYALSQDMEKRIREKYQSDTIKIHIIGIAKIIGDLTEGIFEIVLFFLLGLIISLVVLYWYTRCIISTSILLACAIISVIWQLGLIKTFGIALSAYSCLVPFLVLAISISHGVQNVNATALNMAKGDSAFNASRHSFLTLFIPGMTALLGDGVGFMTLWLIDIPSIKELAIAASIGVAVIIFTKLILLTIIMSYTGISTSGVKHAIERDKKEPLIWRTASKAATPKIAAVCILAAIVMSSSLYMSYGKNVKVGDLDKGAPELRPDSRYNTDNNYITDNYSISSDVLGVMVKTKSQTCLDYENLEVMDRLSWTLANVEGVQSSIALPDIVRQIISGFNEGNLKWNTLTRNQADIDSTIFQIPRNYFMINSDCSFSMVMVFLADHKAETLARVLNVAENFIEKNKMQNLEFHLATGNAGIEAATNDVIVEAYYTMLFLVYAAVSLLVCISFKSIRATICIISPLVVTSVLCDSLMAYLGIGLKVATLPVVALSVGIGVDYSIYIYAKMETYIYKGMAMKEAYFNTLKTTGYAIVLTALTLAIGVVTWAWSPIKFQADMGILLTFMFIWNMIGAIWLLPALCCFFIDDDGVRKKIAKKEAKNRMRFRKPHAHPQAAMA